jgi:hypothetical protein
MFVQGGLIQSDFRTKPLDIRPGRYRPPDGILGLLDGL